MSGFLSGFLGGQPQGRGNQIADVLQQVLAQNGGGVGSLISRFTQAGLGTQAQSWMSNGANQPISPEHVQQVFTDDEINGWAQQAGTSPENMSRILSEALPHAVDHVTSNGQVPPAGQALDLRGLVSRFLG
jgi:uncharacterized protein YidB (DUF937 family)